MDRIQLRVILHFAFQIQLFEHVQSALLSSISHAGPSL